MLVPPQCGAQKQTRRHTALHWQVFVLLPGQTYPHAYRIWHTSKAAPASSTSRRATVYLLTSLSGVRLRRTSAADDTKKRRYDKAKAQQATLGNAALKDSRCVAVLEAAAFISACLITAAQTDLSAPPTGLGRVPTPTGPSLVPGAVSGRSPAGCFYLWHIVQQRSRAQVCPPGVGPGQNRAGMMPTYNQYAEFCLVSCW